MKKIKLLLGFALVAGSASAVTILDDAQWMGFGRDAAATIGAAGTVVGKDLSGDPRYHFDATIEQVLSNPDTTKYGFVTVTNSVSALGLSSTPDIWEAMFFNSTTNGVSVGALQSAYVTGTKGGVAYSGFVLSPSLFLPLEDPQNYVLLTGQQKTLTWDMHVARAFGGDYGEVVVTAVHAFGLTMVGGESFGYPGTGMVELALDITSDAPVRLVKNWGFNTIGDTENFTANADVVGLTTAMTISGAEGVLTSSDIIQSGDVLDPQCFYNEGGETNLFITPPGPWETMTIRMRQLSGNPGEGGTAPAVFDINQVIFLVNAEVLDLGTDIISSTNEANEWVQAVLDISVIGNANLESIRIDPIANDIQNFEIDYLQVSAQSWGGKYTVWAEEVYKLTGVAAQMESDPDGDTYNNLYEYAFGGDPTNAAEFGFVQSGVVGSDFEYLFKRRTDEDNGLGYAFEQRSDLVTESWFTNTTDEVGTGPIVDDYEVVTNRVETVNPADFFRVKVSGLE